MEKNSQARSVLIALMTMAIRLRALPDALQVLISEQRGDRPGQSLILGARWVVIPWAVHSRADWVLLHEAGIERPQAIGDAAWIHYARSSHKS